MKRIDKDKVERERIRERAMMNEAAPLLVTTIETDQGETQANVVDGMYAIAGAIHHLAEVIAWQGDPGPDEEEPCVRPDCQEAMKHRTQ